ncbi:MAG: restriction endonuclease subunit S [Planctomycetes bacterium]|nr:restriction endonuclease subunit S [Planctomycetota bacterium]
MTALSGNPHASVVWWSELERWVNPNNTLRFTRLPEGWKVARMGDVVRQFSEREKVKADAQYRMIGVKWYGEGTFHRETVKGDAISANHLYRVLPGALIYNRLFAWKGSFAVVPQTHAGFFVSGEFPQFQADSSKLLPEYLYLYCVTGPFIRAVNAASIGSAAVSRNRFKEEEFLGFAVAVPPLAVQRAIVRRWREGQEATLKARQAVAKIEMDILAGFLKALAIEPPKMAHTPKAFAVWWKDFLRWSVSYNQAALNSIDLSRGKYTVLELGSVLSLVQYGTSEKANTTDKGTRVLRINNIKKGTIVLSDLKHIPLAKKALANLILAAGDILIIRTSGSRDLVGTCGVFHAEGEYVFASYLIRLRACADKANPDFLAYFLNSPLGRQQINAVSRQIMQNNINTQELRQLRVCLPPLDVQRRIVGMVSKRRAEIAAARQAAAKKSAEIAQEVEDMILGKLAVPGAKV